MYLLIRAIEHEYLAFFIQFQILFFNKQFILTKKIHLNS